MPATLRLSLIGAPTDIGAGARGASMGPEALRVAGLQRRCAHGLRCWTAATWRPGQPLAAAGGRLPPPGRGGGLEPAACTTRCCRTAAGPPAHPAGRRPLPGRRQHQRRGAPLPRGRQEAARAVAGRACRLQHQRAHAQRQPARHAGGLPVRPWAAAAGGDRRPGAGADPQVGAPDRHPQRRPGEKRLVHEAGLEVFDMRYIDEMGMRHTMELALATLDANTHLHVSFDVDFLDPRSPPAWAPPCPAAPPTAKRSCAWR
jgi:arginase